MSNFLYKTHCLFAFTTADEDVWEERIICSLYLYLQLASVYKKNTMYYLLNTSVRTGPIWCYHVALKYFAVYLCIKLIFLSKYLASAATTFWYYSWSCEGEPSWRYKGTNMDLISKWFWFCNFSNAVKITKIR